jgi:diguanylate cyclase (GGDEF)-like protein/PAS domain S-box-containing protein
MTSQTELPKILIVDDKKENLIVLEKLLANFPIQIIKAQSGNDALSAMIEHEFVLVLLDVQMPGMSGYEVLEVMSWDEKTRYIPVIFITANYADEQHKMKGYQYGAVDYLYKPINDVVLLSKVRVFLDLYNQRIQYKQLNQRYELILNAAGEGIFGIDKNSTITFINPAAEKVLTYPKNILVGQPFATLLKIAPPVNEIETVWQEADIYTACSQGNIFHKDDTAFAKHDGSLLPVEFTASPIHNAFDEYEGVVIVFSDITLRKTVEEQLTNLALYDHLTKLPNRLLFEKTISQSLARSRRNNKLMALMFLDLDHFKDINDRLGHDVGDLLLKGVSDRLISCIRETDTVARLGGDEFAIILDELSVTEDAAAIAEKIINALVPPFYLNGNEVNATTSIGIAVYPMSGDTIQTLTKNADIAMYQAKQSGRNNYCYFTDTMNEKVRFKLEMVHNLRYALERNELELYYQPKIELKTRKIVGAEALLRWHHPELGTLLPTEFLQIAEETGMMPKIGSWVIEQACQANKSWEHIGDNRIRVAVNLSTTQLSQDDLVSIIKQALDNSHLSPDLFEIEITETSLVNHSEKAMATIINLHKLGIHISIDDFGIGYSSLSYLKQLPVDSLKIDQSFVRDLSIDSNDAAIIKAVTALAHNLGLGVVAEGVETEEQLAFLETNECDQVQGFFFSTPLSATEMAKLLKEPPLIIKD